ncbi:MAG: thermonuclease family protein [bacterium]|nr:thermonuclease family protein [bacterium]
MGEDNKKQVSWWVKVVLAVVVFLSSLLGILAGEENFYPLPSENGGSGTGARTGSTKVIVVYVTDGDSLRVKDINTDNVYDARYVGVNTPEMDGEDYETCFAQEAKEANEDLVEGEELILEFAGDKSYDRELVYAYTTNWSGEKDEFINELLLKEGYGRFYLDKENTGYQDELIEAALLAQENFEGLWGICGEEKYDNKCIIKGNVDIHGKRYYHIPGDKYYDEVVVNLNKEDKWLCRQEEAEGKGFTHANQ